MVDVFVSYKRDERRRAETVARKLRDLGLDVWIDARIPTGVAFDSEIEGALKDAKAVLVLWTPSSVASEWVRNEASVGKERGVLVSLMLAPCELPVAFRSVQFEPLFTARFADDHPSWVKVTERIKDLIGRRPEIERQSRRVQFRRKRNSVLLWLLFWPIGALALTVGVGAATSSYEVTPQFGSFYAESWRHGYFAARGTWELEGEDLAAPINVVDITCSIEDGFCLETRAEIFKRGRILSVTADRRPILSWSEDAIVTKNETACADYVMTISRRSESVVALQTQRATPSATAPPSLIDCNLLDPRKEFRLVDGGQRAIDGIGERVLRFQGILFSLLAAWTLGVAWRIARVIFARPIA